MFQHTAWSLLGYYHLQCALSDPAYIITPAIKLKKESNKLWKIGIIYQNFIFSLRSESQMAPSKSFEHINMTYPHYSEGVMLRQRLLNLWF